MLCDSAPRRCFFGLLFFPFCAGYFERILFVLEIEFGTFVGVVHPVKNIVHCSLADMCMRHGIKVATKKIGRPDRCVVPQVYRRLRQGFFGGRLELRIRNTRTPRDLGHWKRVQSAIVEVVNPAANSRVADAQVGCDGCGRLALHRHLQGQSFARFPTARGRRTRLAQASSLGRCQFSCEEWLLHSIPFQNNYPLKGASAKVDP